MSGLTLPTNDCPCGSGRLFEACCGAVHADLARATTAEALMRSRFSAFARCDAAFLLKSWHPDRRPPVLELDDSIRWLRLEISDVVAGGPTDETGVVEFRAYYESGGVPGVLHERSRFRRLDTIWQYLDASE